MCLVSSGRDKGLSAPSKAVIWFKGSAHNIPFGQPVCLTLEAGDTSKLWVFALRRWEERGDGPLFVDGNDAACTRA